MLIENHSGIFRVEKRLREFGEFKLPGDGITYAQIQGGAVGVVLGLPLLIPAWLLTRFITGGMLVLIIYGITALIFLAVVWGASKVLSRPNEVNESPLNQIVGRINYQRSSKTMIDGEYFRRSSQKHTFECVVDASDR
jgi:hypothetical protein